MEKTEHTFKVSRQVYRRLAVQQHFRRVCQEFGGGINWSGAECMPRKNRRRIARARAKAEIRERRTA